MLLGSRLFWVAAWLSVLSVSAGSLWLAVRGKPNYFAIAWPFLLLWAWYTTAQAQRLARDLTTQLQVSAAVCAQLALRHCQLVSIIRRTTGGCDE